MSTPQCEAIQITARRAAATLRDGRFPYALAGGLAAWAHGGPEVDHDVDFVIIPSDADQVLSAFEQAGFRTERPLEHWLYKAWDDDVLIDLIFEMTNQTSSALIAHSEEIAVLSMKMPVMSVDDILITKLEALNEHHLNYSRLLQISRALREQIDWDYIARQTKDSPFAMAFLTLTKELGIATP